MTGPLELVCSALVLLFGVSALSLFFRSRGRLLAAVCFPLSGAASLLAAGAGAWAVQEGLTETAVLMIGLPDLPFHLRIDPLAGFFLTVIGLLCFLVSIYSVGYVGSISRVRPTGRLIFFVSLFVAAMCMVVLADDALCFLVSWETMAAASYFLVLFEDEKVPNRRAAFLYLVVAHVGALAILLSFGVMAGLAGGLETFHGYTFDAMREAGYPPHWATAAFLLALLGFGAKAGIVPLHIWLPEAHPVAPSNISALMSGVMLKTAIYGIVRVVFDLLHDFPWWWGALILAAGLLSAVFGILFAILQNDLKRLLAYSSVENIGIILIGIGLSMIFTSFQMPLLASLALIASLYHSLNHALFKGLLFMGAGTVLHAVQERNMERMGGLIHILPWTSALFLVGCVAISGLPPFNGFVSEWLTFQAFLLSPSLPSPLMKLLIPMGAALLALTAALSAACFVKAFGITFLGHWRGSHAPRAAEPGWSIRTSMIMTALLCLGLGILPTVVIDWMDRVPEQLVGARISKTAGAFGWMWLTPIAQDRASYSGPIVFAVILSVIAVAYLLLHVRSGALHRVPLWDCGFEKVTRRMQYTSSSFAMPLRRIFGFFFSVSERLKRAPQAGHPAFPVQLHYSLRIRDRFWGWLYAPLVRSSFWIARQVGRLQQGRIQSYLIYSFMTIIVLLMFLR